MPHQAPCRYSTQVPAPTIKHTKERGTAVIKMSDKPLKEIDVPIELLKPHPGQSIFPDLSDVELEELAESMRVHGQQHAADITRGYTMITGHQRWRAAKSLGWATLRCRVRTDLEAREATSPGTIEQHLLDDNVIRRQLSNLDIARICKRQLEIRGESSNGSVLDALARRFKMSHRHLRRLMYLLEAPLELQHAYSRGELSADLLGKLVDLPAAEQEEIVHRIIDC